MKEINVAEFVNDANLEREIQLEKAVETAVRTSQRRNNIKHMKEEREDRIVLKLHNIVSAILTTIVITMITYLFLAIFFSPFESTYEREFTVTNIEGNIQDGKHMFVSVNNVGFEVPLRDSVVEGETVRVCFRDWRGTAMLEDDTIVDVVYLSDSLFVRFLKYQL